MLFQNGLPKKLPDKSSVLQAETLTIMKARTRIQYETYTNRIGQPIAGNYLAELGSLSLDELDEIRYIYGITFVWVPDTATAKLGGVSVIITTLQEKHGVAKRHLQNDSVLTCEDTNPSVSMLPK